MLRELSVVSRDREGMFLRINDGLAGVEEAFLDVYSKADGYVIHKVRNTLNKVRKNEQYEAAEDLKVIYCSFTQKATLTQFQAFQEK